MLLRVPIFFLLLLSTVLAADTCDNHDVSAVTKQLKYIGPHQRIYKEGRMNYRCFQGQHWEDLYMLKHFLHNISGGFFIELGALDGYSYSISYFFEQYLDWKGLMIEASPKNLAAYKARSGKLKPKRRRRNEFVLSAVCNEPKPITYVSKSGTGAGILEFMPESEQLRNKKECEYPPAAPQGASKEEAMQSALDFKPRSGCSLIPINCVHLGDELKRRQIDHIDMFVLDVEGAELEVLQTLRLDEVPVRYFLIELDGKNSDKDKLVRCILRRAGFEPIGRLDLNEIWTNPAFDATKYSYKPPVPESKWQGCFVSPLQLGDGNDKAHPPPPPLRGRDGGGNGNAATSDDDFSRLDPDDPEHVKPTAAQQHGGDVEMSLKMASPVSMVVLVSLLVAIAWFLGKKRRSGGKK